MRRYKRFLADVVLDDGTALTVHCPNTGAMLGCQDPGSRVWLSVSDNPSRKYPHTWEIVETRKGVLVGINTQRSNALVAEAIERGLPASLADYSCCRREVSVVDGRLDFLLSGHAEQPDCFVEVKNVTAAVHDGTALFPDAKSTRALRHIESLMTIRSRGLRAVVIFCVQRSDVSRVEPAVAIDPAFSAALATAGDSGVELLALGARVDPGCIELVEQLSVTMPAL